MKTQLSLNLLPDPMSPREFCRAWYGLDKLPPQEAVEIEIQEGYRKKYIALLSQVTGATTRAVRSWGKGLNFEKMPEKYQQHLACALHCALTEVSKRRVA